MSFDRTTTIPKRQETLGEILDQHRDKIAEMNSRDPFERTIKLDPLTVAYMVNRMQECIDSHREHGDVEAVEAMENMRDYAQQ